MKVAFVLNTPRAASFKLAQMILPQLEAGTHGVEVVGIFFFDDDVWALRKGDPIGERLASWPKTPECSSWAVTTARWSATWPRVSRAGAIATGQGGTGPAECQPVDMMEGATVGCFPDLYGALAGNMPDQVISL